MSLINDIVLDFDAINMIKAIEEASHSLKHDVLPVGAVVVLTDGSIIAKAHKTPYEHPRVGHAETVAIEQALRDYRWAKGMTVYSTLEPCAMCFGHMLNSRVSRIVYALDDPYGGACCCASLESLPVRHRNDPPEITRGVMAEEVKVIFRKFFETTNNSFWSIKNEENKDNPLIRSCYE